MRWLCRSRKSKGHHRQDSSLRNYEIEFHFTNIYRVSIEMLLTVLMLYIRGMEESSSIVQVLVHFNIVFSFLFLREKSCLHVPRW